MMYVNDVPVGPGIFNPVWTQEQYDNNPYKINLDDIPTIDEVREIRPDLVENYEREQEAMQQQQYVEQIHFNNNAPIYGNGGGLQQQIVNASYNINQQPYGIGNQGYNNQQSYAIGGQGYNPCTQPQITREQYEQMYRQVNPYVLDGLSNNRSFTPADVGAADDYNPMLLRLEVAQKNYHDIKRFEEFNSHISPIQAQYNFQQEIRQQQMEAEMYQRDSKNLEIDDSTPTERYCYYTMIEEEEKDNTYQLYYAPLNDEDEATKFTKEQITHVYAQNTSTAPLNSPIISNGYYGMTFANQYEQQFYQQQMSNERKEEIKIMKMLSKNCRKVLGLDSSDEVIDEMYDPKPLTKEQIEDIQETELYYKLAMIKSNPNSYINWEHVRRVERHNQIYDNHVNIYNGCNSLRDCMVRFGDAYAVMLEEKEWRRRHDGQRKFTAKSYAEELRNKLLNDASGRMDIPGISSRLNTNLIRVPNVPGMSINERGGLEVTLPDHLNTEYAQRRAEFVDRLTKLMER